MPQFTIETTPDEQAAVLKVLKKYENKEVPVRVVATEAGIPQSRARYAIEDLVEANKICRIATKAYNKHYMRYVYKIV